MFRYKAWSAAWGCLLSLAAIFGLLVLDVVVAVVITGWSGQDNSPRGSLALFGFVAAPIWWLFRLADRHRMRPYEMRCDLRTIPAIPGGTIKADIEVLMSEPATGFSVELRRQGRGKSNRGGWHKRETVPRELTKSGGEGVYRFPVEMEVPRLSPLSGAPWTLVVDAGCQRRGSFYQIGFPVPVSE